MSERIEPAATTSSSRCAGSRRRSPASSPTTTSTSSSRRGEVHALLGENGAGKSTLMNILYGLYKPDAGEIRLNGKPVTFHSAKDAIGAGIGMVHQHFMLIPVMTVAENIVLGIEPTQDGIILDERGAEERVREISQQFGLAVEPTALDLGDHRRPAAARRDPEGALPRRRDPDPRRADGRADAAGGDRAVRDRQEPPGRRQVDHLHQPQAQRGARDRRPDDRPAPRQEDRDGAVRRRDARSRSRSAMVGREVLLRVEKPPAQPGRAAARRSRTCT